MIIDTRKSLKSVKLLWVAIAIAMLLGGSGISFWWQSDSGNVLGWVNGVALTAKKFEDGVRKEAQQRERLKSMGYNFQGGPNLRMIAAACVRDLIRDDLAKSVGVTVSGSSLGKSLQKIIPKDVFGPEGIDVSKYSDLVRAYTGMKIQEFEDEHARDLSREAMDNLISATQFEPFYVTKQRSKESNAKKSFAWYEIPFSRFINEIEKEGVAEKQVAAYVNANAEDFLTSIGYQAKAITFEKKEVQASIDVSDGEILDYYNTNKHVKYYLPAKYDILYLVFKDGESKDQEIRSVMEEVRSEGISVLKKAEKIAKKTDAFIEAKAPKGIALGRGQLASDAIETVLASLEPGKWSDSIEMGNLRACVYIVKKDLAQTKSLEEVKGEISSHILGQKSLHAISRLAEKVLAAFRENPDVDSAEVNKLLSDNSWTTKHNFLLLQMDSAKRESFSKEEELVFANIDSKKTAGKSVEGSTGVVKTDFGVTAYVVTKVSWPTMKPFDKVKKQAEGSYVKQVASERSKLFVEDLHRKLLNKDVSWDDLASEIGIKETKSSLDSLENLKDKHKNMALVIQKSFKLSDSKQVLRQKDDHDYYIVKLSEKEEGTAKETQEIAQTNRFGGDYKEMVLADLVKAAKIESSEGLVDLLDDNATLGGR